MDGWNIFIGELMDGLFFPSRKSMDGITGCFCFLFRVDHFPEVKLGYQ